MQRCGETSGHVTRGRTQTFRPDVCDGNHIMTDSQRNRGADATPARVLIVGDTASFAEGLAAAVGDLGHEVMSARDFDAALGVAQDQRPDAVLVGGADLHGSRLGFQAQVREMVAAAKSPVFVILPSATDLDMRKDALRAGAAHVFEGPVDTEEVALRLESTVAVLRAADRARTGALVDVETGLYNAAGLARRSREVSAEAMRAHQPLACVVIGASLDDDLAVRDASVRSAEVLRSTGRLSDIIGRIGALEFVVLAPGTDERGALQMALRLSTGVRFALARAMTPDSCGRMVTGYTAMANLSYSPVESGELLARATSALRAGRLASSFEWLPSYDLERGPQS
jgi:PleD family two-component response regulator